MEAQAYVEETDGERPRLMTVWGTGVIFATRVASQLP